MKDKLQPPITEVPHYNEKRPGTGRREWLIDYMKNEYEGQIPKLRALGINTDDCFFEQAINSVIYMAERYGEQLASLKAENEALKKQIAEKDEWINSHM